MTKNNSEELELAKEVARKAKVLAQERQDKMLATVRAEFYVQLSEVLKAGVVKAATWHVGENKPTADFGRAGDLYLDITTADVLFNNAGEWQVVLNVRPKDGIDGKDGKDGEKGEQGKIGLAGERGKAGRDGKDGKDGRNGRDGVDGARGRDGKDGRDGSRWFSEKGKPNYSLGSKNDFYLDATSGDFYMKESDLSWVRKGSLKPDNVTGGFIVSGGTGGGSGEAGADGREVELQANATHIQWRYVGDASWTNIVPLADIKGVDGTDGTDGTDGAFAGRTIVGTTNQVVITNGDGVAGNPTISLPQNIHTGATPTFLGLAIDTNTLFVDPTNHYVGILTANPTHTVTVGYGSNGIVLYNTASQVTNYERLRIFTSGSDYNVKPEAGGTGTIRNLLLWGGVTALTLRVSESTSGAFELSRSLSSAGAIHTKLIGTLSASSGIQYGLAVTPTIAQSSTAGYTAIFANVTESTVGSGTKLYMDLQKNGTSVLKYDEYTTLTLNGTTPTFRLTATGNYNGFVGIISGTENYRVGQQGHTGFNVYTGSSPVRALNIDSSQNATFYGTIASTSASASNNSMFVNTGALGNRASINLRGYNASNSGDFFTIEQRTDTAETIMYTYDASASSYLTLLTYSYLSGIVTFSQNIGVGDGKNIVLNATTGTKLGTATSQKLGIWNATPIAQPTTSVASATFVGNGGATVTDTDTFDGYSIKQVVKALRNIGLLA